MIQSAINRTRHLMIIVAFILFMPVSQVFADTPGSLPETLSIQSKINNGPWKTGRSVSPLTGDTLSLRPGIIPLKGMTLKWYRIIPDLSTLYKNANFPWDPEPYTWQGYATIKYTKTEITEYRNKWLIHPTFNTYPESGYMRTDYGSFWIVAEIELDGQRLSSPGLESCDHRGLSPDVFRISIRKSPGYIGFLTSFFNVPGLFGSVTYQSYNYIGIDCADVLMAAFARWKQQPATRNYNVAMLVNSLPKIAEFQMSAGTPEKTIRWSSLIQPGDFIAVRGSGYSQYYHIGAVTEDSNKNGILDRDDSVLHAGPAPLHYSSLGDGVFDGHVVILRPRASTLLGSR